MASSAPPRIGLVGLGSMGMGMARSLLRAGHRVRGFDTDPARVTAFVAAGGEGGVLADAAPGLDILILVVVSAAQIESVLFGQAGIAARLRSGAVVIGCSTIDPGAARDFEARLEAGGQLFADAPISGGAGKAAEGALTVMLSGRPAALQAARPVLVATATRIFELGDRAGPASAMKMINQHLAGIHIVAAAEAITLGIAQGIAPAETLRVISACAGTSWMFEDRGPHIVAGDYAPRSAVDIFVKDLSMVAGAARQAGFAAPLAEAALGQFEAAAQAGLGREDDAAVAKVYARQAGLRLPGDIRAR